MLSPRCMSFQFLSSVDFIGGPQHYSTAEAPVSLKHAGTLISSPSFSSLFSLYAFRLLSL